MSKFTMERNIPMQNGASRIPRFDYGSKNMSSANAFNQQQPLPSVGASQKPSKLHQMQKEYQKNILKEKEDKIITMYEDSQKKALNRVNQNKGVLRDFFNERRAGSGGSNSSTTPTMEQLYQNKKMENNFGPTNGYAMNGGPPRNKPVSKYPSYNRGNFNEKKPSAGRDRANPLAPIQRRNEEPENPFAKRKPQIVRPRTYKGVQTNKDHSEDMKVPRSAPNGFINSFHSDENLVDYNEDDSPLPSTRQFQHLQQKKQKMLQDQRLHNKARTQLQSAQSSRKGSNRRHAPLEYVTSEEDEGYDEANESGSTSNEDEMKKKQKELLAQIEAQQRELDRLKNERMNAEMEEKKEAERRKKFEEERRKKRIADERRRQIEEEEEKVRQQLEEEKQKKIAKEKQRMRHVSQSSYETASNYGNSNYERQPSPSPEPEHYIETKPSPAPPPKPKPTNTRKPMPKKPPPKTRSPSPKLASGDHTALYENADHLDGAYENVGRLKACFNCGRKFAEDRLGKHEQSCKNITKKRKVMDPAKTRVRGTELEQYQGHRQPTPPKVKKNNWRAKHENFQQAIRYAKKASQIEREGGNLADLPPPPPTENPDYVQCPYCSRKFNASSAERHIPHCKNTKARAKPPPQRRR